ncbi:MAG: glycoside hydrolase family 28 protein, partial [Acidobacteriota bacterium]|nr:glycoside hydrolase family 28 protein [Acidobacteriota bacterium]
MQNRREFLQLLIAGAGASLVLPNINFGQTAAKQTADAWAQVPQILARIVPPKFPKKDFDITKYGAQVAGKNDATDAIRRAIEDCSKAGGGRVVVPNGEFSTGAIHLKSNVNLYVSKGATLKFLQDIKKYPTVFTRFEGTELMNFSPFIYAFEQTNIAVTGEGTLDGQADAAHWWNWKNGKSQPNQNADRKVLLEMAETGVPVEKRIFGEGHFMRTQFVQPYRCKNVLIDGLTIVNSPMWEINPVLCENVTVQNLKINSHGPNNDGCDPESCKDVLIKNCVFDTGDDCIAIKSGRNADGRRINVPSENIVVMDCEMRDGHGGITVGSEISGGVRNVFGMNCKLDSPHLDHALRVKNNASRGGLLENFYFKNIRVGQVAHAVITIDFNYEEGAKGSFTPVMRNFSVENLTSGKSEYGVDIQGLDNAPVYD